MHSREGSHPSIQHGCCFVGPLELPLVPPHFNDGVSLFCQSLLYPISPREEIAAPESRKDGSYHHNSTRDQVFL